MARTGRPRLPDEQKRDEQIVVRVTAAEKQQCEQAAGDRPVSAWAREKLLNAASRHRRHPREPDASRAAQAVIAANKTNREKPEP